MLNIFGPLPGRRDLLVAIAGRSVSVLGDEVALVALMLRLQAAHARPYEIALLLAAGMLPIVLLYGVAGRVADSADSRHILVTASVAQACCCVPLIFARDVPEMIILVALLGTGGAFAQATWQALMPRLAGEDRIAAAVSAQQSGSSLAAVAAPAAGGLLCTSFGTGVPVAVDGATFAVMAVAALTVRIRRRGAATAGLAGPGGPGSKRGGWAILRADAILAPLVVGLTTFALLAMMVNVVLVFLIRGTLHAAPAWYGGLEAIWMLGVIGGALASGRIRTDHVRAQTAFAGTGLIALAFLGYGLAPRVIALVPIAVLGGLGNGMLSSCVATLVVTRTPDGMRGRVSAALNGAVNSASVVSLAAGGGLALLLDPRQIFLVAGSLGLAAGVLVAMRVRKQGTLPGPARVPMAAQTAEPDLVGARPSRGSRDTGG
ncbi:MAG TPA: MFS transporter [Streptosporangiaceae bacterium]|jgi:MFS family permease